MTRLFDSDKKYKVMLVILLTIFVFIIVGVIAMSTIEKEEKVDGPIATVVNEGDLIISYNDGRVIDFSDSKKHVYSVSITNNGSSKVYYSIVIEDCNTETLSVIVKDKEGKVVNEKKKVSDKILNLYSVEANETVRYSIEVKSNRLFNVSGVLRVINESLSTEMFADMILLNNTISVAKTRLGTDIATENEGLIESYDNDGKSYYFRGNVNNNYFKMGDLLFRVVRVNGDNSVRVVLDSILEEKMPFNVNSIPEGGTASDLALYANSSVLTKLEEWYTKELKKFDAYITKGSYCSDSNFDLVNNNIIYSDTYERIINDEAPDLFCNGTVSKAKIGLLNVDEIVLAGAAGNIPNTQYYLYNKKIEGNYLTTSSYSINSQNGVTMINIMSNGALGDGILIGETSYIRPVINIGTNAKIKGKGTFDNPYIIVS